MAISKIDLGNDATGEPIRPLYVATGDDDTPIINVHMLPTLTKDELKRASSALFTKISYVTHVGYEIRGDSSLIALKLSAINVPGNPYMDDTRREDLMARLNPATRRKIHVEVEVVRHNRAHMSTILVFRVVGGMTFTEADARVVNGRHDVHRAVLFTEDTIGVSMHHPTTSDADNKITRLAERIVGILQGWSPSMIVVTDPDPVAALIKAFDYKPPVWSD